jgi:hypothetical protein
MLRVQIGFCVSFCVWILGYYISSMQKQELKHALIQTVPPKLFT